MVSSQEVPGTWKLLSPARGGCIGGDIGRRDDRGHPPRAVSVSTEATSTYIPVGKVRGGCPGVLRVLKMDRSMRVASLLFTTLVYRLPLGYHRTAAKFLCIHIHPWVVALPRITLPRLLSRCLFLPSPLSTGIVSIIGSQFGGPPRIVHTVYEYRNTSLVNVMVQ